MILGFQKGRRAVHRRAAFGKDEAIAMHRGMLSTVRKVVVSLLLLAALLIYAPPSHAERTYHQQSVATLAEQEHGQGPCEDFRLLGNGACCSAAQCITMHGALPTAAVDAFIPRLNTSSHLPALATPEGIGIGPALRPPL
ncbi:hypothetical protein [Azospirillum soli]|uniref:hypothetical protein n=1 Tax=Azospirillum soli TaxID=1304799 RepID=UPI001AE23561|nr:hypothetical protein [Azospirillum soli]MBP2316195.1 hypothetical protein [Azospirillum soli]